MLLLKNELLRNDYLVVQPATGLKGGVASVPRAAANTLRVVINMKVIHT